MNWVDILKNVITQGRVKEIEDIDIDIEDDDCKRELKRLADKLKNYKSVVEKKWNTGWHKKYENAGYAKDVKIVMDYEPSADGDSKRFTTRIIYYESQEKQYSVFSLSDFLIYYVYKLDDVPESVACRALEMLKEEKSDNENIEINGTYYRIERTFAKTYPVTTEEYSTYADKFMINGIQIYKGGETVLLLELIAETATKPSSMTPPRMPLREMSRESGIFADMKMADKWVTR